MKTVHEDNISLRHLKLILERAANGQRKNPPLCVIVASHILRPRCYLKDSQATVRHTISTLTMAGKTPYTLEGVFWTKSAYRQVSAEFHPYHRHDLNAFVHLFTTGLGIWGAIQLAKLHGFESIVAAYSVIIALTTPFLTAVVHTALVAAIAMVPSLQVDAVPLEMNGVYICLLAIAAGYGLQDLSHYVFQEKTYMGAYIYTLPLMLFVHTIWLLPLVIDSILMRWCFLPNVVSRNRTFFTQVSSRKAVENLRDWINTNVAQVKETTHVWPHDQEGTSGPVTALEDDAAIHAGFRTIFASKHFDVKPVVGMNEIYVTAVGAKKDINSDAVFYTPHTDGPYWFLPGASLYRVLVGVTPNRMVRTRFNLQHSSQDRVVDMYDVLGFDYSRELHWIDHVPGKTNDERRSLIKLHFIVYPKGWHGYGDFCAKLQTNYNTWARGNFLKTLRPDGVADFILAWWIWLTTWSNAIFEENVGWSNLVYILLSSALGPTAFLVLTSFRHYLIYMTTFDFRNPPVAHGYLMRDSKLFKSMAMAHLGRRLLPLVKLPHDLPGVLLVAIGFFITILATTRLGFVRTYFGSELGFVKPEWINGFPYGYIPHPMIVGQLIAFGSIIFWWRESLSSENLALLVAHMTFYTLHMVQEMLHSSY